MTFAVTAESAAHMRAIGERLGERLQPGDILILNGPLGAGKTTLTQGIAAGLGVVGAVTSPTFVISRLHNDSAGAVRLVHVDAYRLSSPRDLHSLDLDDYLSTAAMVVEWGQRVLDADDPAYTVIDIARPGGEVGRSSELVDGASDEASGRRSVEKPGATSAERSGQRVDAVFDESGPRVLTLPDRFAELAQ